MVQQTLWVNRHTSTFSPTSTFKLLVICHWEDHFSRSQMKIWKTLSLSLCLSWWMWVRFLLLKLDSLCKNYIDIVVLRINRAVKLTEVFLYFSSILVDAAIYSIASNKIVLCYTPKSGQLMSTNLTWNHTTQIYSGITRGRMLKDYRS